jgi:zinc D-Ala-D-Ala carboxypeptidase
MRMLYHRISLVPTDDWRWPHFTARELACRCHGRFCKGAYWHDPSFLDALEALRALIGTPLVITSAHRCRLWNAAVGGAPRSQHKRIAVDVALGGHTAAALADAAVTCGFTGIGLARNFIHLDRRAHPARWTYARKE